MEWLLKTLQGHTADVNALCLLGDGVTLASGSDDNTIRFWNTKTGACVNTLQGHTDIVSSLCLLGDGVTLASGSSDGTIRFWHPDAGFFCQCWRLRAVLRALRDITANQRPSVAGCHELVVTLVGV